MSRALQAEVQTDGQEHLPRGLLPHKAKRMTGGTEGHRGATPGDTSAGGFGHRRKLKGLSTHFLGSHGRDRL